MRGRFVADLDAVAGALSKRPGPDEDPERWERAKAGMDLIQRVLDGDGDADVAYLLDLDDEVFDAAHEIVDGGHEPATRVMAEKISEQTFERMLASLARLSATPDPDLRDEFV